MSSHISAGGVNADGNAHPYHKRIQATGLSGPGNDLPWKPYVRRDPDAGRQEQVESLLAGIRARLAADLTDEPGLDDMGYEWRREQLAELDGPPCCRACGYLVIRCSCPGRTAARRAELDEAVRGWRKTP